VLNDGHEVLAVMTLRNEERALGIAVDSRSNTFTSLVGNCPVRV
jgi:hypothetical protein